MVKIRAFLVQRGCVTALEGEIKLPKVMAKSLKKDILAKAHIAIILSLVNEVLWEVVDQTIDVGLWEKV